MTLTLSNGDARLMPQATHLHDADELTWVASGSCTIEINGYRWRIDADTALVIPANIEHTVLPRPDSLVFPLIFPEGLTSQMKPFTVGRSPMLDACARLLLQSGLSTVEAIAAARSEIQNLVRETQLPRGPAMPIDPRAREVADTLLADPSCPLGLEEWARSVHTSGKTLQRSFRRETGMTFPEWRTAVRLAAARQRLERGEHVHVVAHAVGYLSSSAFIAAFRRTFGITPGECRARVTI